jgi:response regulator RpfG family c-di-GMP phosphodiesterase
MQILIVDDEPLELFLSKRFLGMEYKTEGFNTLTDALQWAKSNPFDILVSDYYLGGNTHANDVLKALEEVKGKTFKSFVLTNHIDDDKKTALIAAGFNGVIEKPLSLENFKRLAGLP